MSTALLPWLMAALLALASATLQWTVLRARHRQALEAQRARLETQQKVTVAKLDHAKRQIAQLQQDLAAARLELKRRPQRAAAPAPVARSSPPALEELLRVLDDDEDDVPARHRLPADGFADTLPSPQYPHGPELLRR
jgi:hypothetical protein